MSRCKEDVGCNAETPEAKKDGQAIRTARREGGRSQDAQHPNAPTQPPVLYERKDDGGPSLFFLTLSTQDSALVGGGSQLVVWRKGSLQRQWKGK